MELISITNPADNAEMELFQMVASRVYRNDPVWAPPSEMMWRQRFQQLHKDPDAFVMPVIMVEKNQPVARCLLQLVPEALDEQGYPQGWIGFFECREDFRETAQVLLSHGEKLLLQHGARTVLISKSDNQMAGILTSGFDLPHLVFTNHNPDYYLGLLKSAGYIPETRMVTLYFTRESARAIHLRLLGLHTREFDRANLDQEIETFHNLQTEIFKGRPGYIPRTFEEDSQLVSSLLPFLEDDLIIIAETSSGLPVGLLVCIPDLYQHIQGEETTRARIMSIGAIPGYTNRGVGALMGVHLMNNLFKNKPQVHVCGSILDIKPQSPASKPGQTVSCLAGKRILALEKKAGAVK